MLRVISVAAVGLVCSGCFGGPGGGGATGDGLDPDDPSASACGTNGGVLEGSVFYWGLPGDPDSVAADSVDVFLTNGGPTYRTPTNVNGMFSIAIIEGDWTVVADDQTGCLAENSETVTIERCETTTVELLIDVCAY